MRVIRTSGTAGSADDDGYDANDGHGDDRRATKR
jgi:hypothetical protein